jgi:hypothetical protein
MPRRKKNELLTVPPEPRKRRRRSLAEQPAPQTGLLPASEPVSETPAPGLSPNDPPVQSSAFAEAERVLAAKYPHVKVVPGSLRPGAAEGWGSKRVLDLTCVDCGTKRTVATSDLFHSDSRCAACSKAAKRAGKKRET